MFAFVLRKLRD